VGWIVQNGARLNFDGNGVKMSLSIIIYHPGEKVKEKSMRLDRDGHEKNLKKDLQFTAKYGKIRHAGEPPENR